MLNILITFAQYEREVITERVRDKMAASRMKGMWMGGNVPMGYDVVNKKVAFTQLVNPTGKNHNVLAGFLADQLVTCLICDEISSEAQVALDDWGIQLYAGCAGRADDRVDELLAGTLEAAFSTARSSHHL